MLAPGRLEIALFVLQAFCFSSVARRGFESKTQALGERKGQWYVFRRATFRFAAEADGDRGVSVFNNSEIGAYHEE